MSSTFLGGTLIAFACACSPPAPATTSAAILGGPLPPVPALLPAVHLVEDDAVGDPVFLRPHIPPLRSTGDGRVAIDLKKPDPTHVGFYLFAPEKLASSWITSPAGVTVLASTAPYKVHRNDFYEGHVYAPVANNLATTDHRTLCDAWPVANPRKNPYACDDDPALDCYDVTVISTYRHHARTIQLHGKPIRIKVSNPKEATAAIDEIVSDAAILGVSDAVAGPLLPGDFGLEPMVTADGRLLVMRLGDLPATWEDGDGSGRTVTDVFDIVYLVSDPDDPPCDVTQWTRWEPVTHAHGDEQNAMAERYGFAKYPLRDGKGAEYADGEDFGGSYPWIDRDGDNLFFTQLSPTLYYDDGGVLQRRYADQCGPAAACVLPVVPADLTDSVENDEQFRGFSFAGLWSRGKVIQLDNLANNTDYGLGRGEDEHRLLALYSGPTDVRVGTGRDNGADDRPAGAVENTSIIDSWENLFNHDPQAHPTTVRDVVWILNTGKASVEVAFDDYLDVDGVILSEMTGATSKVRPWSTTNQPTYLDGVIQTGPHRATLGGPPEVGNAATSTRWSVPASGIVENGGRIEPVALGGLVGKGLFLHGAGQALSYAMPAQNAVPASWTISLFVDPRVTDDGVARGLLSFPDGTDVALIGLSQLRYRRGGFTRLVSITAHPLVNGQWNHLAWVVRDGGRRVDLYRDGYLFSTWSSANQTLFGLFSAGTFRVGRVTGLDSMRAWIDEVKVFARDPGYEVMCNLAHGTLVRLDSNADAVWWPLAGRYNTHSVLRTLLGTGANTRYVCLHDYSNPESPLLEHLPLAGTSVRAALIFPEGPLHAAQPRPAGSDTNAFCLGCHTPGQPPELGPEALLYDPSLPAQDDLRRQPMQTPPRIFGKVPLNYFPGGNAALDAPADGLLIDPFVIP